MMKLFRHIRFNLIETQKTGRPALPEGRYFKYAIGEIVLVVIGILIALQINNWNEDRKERHQAYRYLSEFKKDLVSDTLQFQYISKILTEVIEAEKQTLMVKNNTEDNLDNVTKAMLMSTYERTINKRTFLNIQNSGKSNLLGYEDLFQKLSNYYIETNRDLGLQTNYDAQQYRDNNAVFERFMRDENYEWSLSTSDTFAVFKKQLGLDSVPSLTSLKRNVYLDFVNTINGRNIITDNIIRHLYMHDKYAKYYNEAKQLLENINLVLEKNK